MNRKIILTLSVSFFIISTSGKLSSEKENSKFVYQITKFLVEYSETKIIRNTITEEDVTELLEENENLSIELKKRIQEKYNGKDEMIQRRVLEDSKKVAQKINVANWNKQMISSYLFKIKPIVGVPIEIGDLFIRVKTNSGNYELRIEIIKSKKGWRLLENIDITELL